MFALARKTKTAANRRKIQPRLDVLEDRTVPATLYVNDNWSLIHDIGPAGLSVGDTVNNSLDVGAHRVTATFGTNAFANINDALAAAHTGDTIDVLAGNYTGNVTVNTSVTLEGANAGASAAFGSSRGAESTLTGGITVNASNVKIDGLKIVGGANITSDVAGVFFAANSQNDSVMNSVLVGNGTGVGVLSSFNGANNNIKIMNNDIGNWTTAVYNQTNSGVQVTGNFIHNNTAGIANDFVTGATIENNTFVDNQEAIGTLDSTNLEAHLNNFIDNTVAVHNYGGAMVDASFNFFGTTDKAAIDAAVVGDVSTTHALSMTVTATTRVFSNGDVSLVIDTATGDFTLTLADGTTVTGTAKIHNNRFEIHEHDHDHDHAAAKFEIHGDLTSQSVELHLQGRNHMNLRLDSEI